MATRMALLILLVSPFTVAREAKFTSQILANDLPGGYQVIACDVNGDGKLDLIALASNLPDLIWFENPGWTRHLLARGLPGMINAACWNREAGKPPLVAVAYEFSMDPRESAGIVALLEPGPDIRQPWKLREIDRLPTSHRLRWANADGSGNKVLINAPLAGAQSRAPDYRGQVPLVYYRPDDWKRRLIGTAEEGIVHGIFVNDWDRKGRDAVLIGSFLGISLYRLGQNDVWSREEIARGSTRPWPKSGTSDLSVGWLRKNTAKPERFLAAIEPWHGNEVVVYRQMGPEAAGPWRRELIDNTILDGHNIETADFDGDGDDEIVAGFRGKPYGVNLYHWNGERWEKHAIEQGEVSAAGCVIAELNRGGPAVACIGSATHNLVLYSQSNRSLGTR